MYLVVTGWLLAGIGADEDEQVGADPVGVGAGRSAHAERRLERDGAGRVTNAGGVVDVVRAHRPHGLLGGVVGLVRHAATGQVIGGAIWIRRTDPIGDQVKRLVPGSGARSRCRLCVGPSGSGNRPSSRSSALALAA